MSFISVSFIFPCRLVASCVTSCLILKCFWICCCWLALTLNDFCILSLCTFYSIFSTLVLISPSLATIILNALTLGYRLSFCFLKLISGSCFSWVIIKNFFSKFCICEFKLFIFSNALSSALETLFLTSICDYFKIFCINDSSTFI